eukprot:SAG11_NODE_6521_length_1296_cov_2.232247_1_plen_68_part_10
MLGAIVKLKDCPDDGCRAHADCGCGTICAKAQNGAAAAAAAGECTSCGADEHAVWRRLQGSCPAIDGE